MYNYQKIDIHVHTLNGNGIKRMGTNTTYATPEQLLVMYKKLGIQKGVILPSVNVECADRTQSNEDVIDIVRKYPDQFYFGTDICSPEHDMKLSFWLDEAVNNKRISLDSYKKVCRDNALELLNA